MIFFRFSDTIGSEMNSTQKTEEKVFSYIAKHHMLAPHDRVVAGISGGADSLCLLFVLLEWAKKSPLSLAVVHVDHGIRKEAGGDARYVEQLCRQFGIPFYLTREDVRERAKREKCSEEEAGRNVRYEAFYRAAKEFYAQKIAVAHNSNDRSETMLFHLFRGSGLKGLCGILPVRDQIIRPVLCLERQEIEQYLRDKNVSWRRDSTNEEDGYTRNRIRHHILPYAEKEIAPGCVSHMAQTADMLCETEEYLEEQTKAAVERCVQEAVSPEARIWEIQADSFQNEHAVIRKRMLFYLVKSLTPSGRDIGYVHIQALSGLLSQEGNRRLDLPFGITARREYGKVFLQRKITGRENAGHTEENTGFSQAVIEKEQLLQAPVNISLGKEGEMEISVFFFENEKEVPQSECTKWFDYDKIEKSLMVRTRQTGDYLSIADGKGGVIHKSLKEYMITAKIPFPLRERIPVLAQEHHVLWLAGYRISEYYKISKNTKRILQVQLRRSCESSKVEENYGREY